MLLEIPGEGVGFAVKLEAAAYRFDPFFKMENLFAITVFILLFAISFIIQ
jgi:hypothetical protein